MQLYYVHTLTPNRAEGDDVEAKHLNKVMRKSVGELAFITSGNGQLWQAEILQLSRSSVVFKPLKKVREEKVRSKLAIAIAPTKRASRVEDFLEKAVELGLSDCHLIKTSRTLRKDFKTKRISRLVISVIKQCLRLQLPSIHEMIAFDEFLKNASDYKNKYIGKIEGDSPALINVDCTDNTIVLIGPEGDFTDEEYDLADKAGFRAVSLSDARLRTETAALMAVATIQDKRRLK